MRIRSGLAALALTALSPLAAPARAQDPFAPQLPFRVECGGNLSFRVPNQQNGWGCQLGPWYNYWPMEAYFTAPALPCFPYWPQPQALMPGGTSVFVPPPYCPPGVPAAPAAVPVPAPAPAAAAPTPAPASKPAYFRPVAD